MMMTRKHNQSDELFTECLCQVLEEILKKKFSFFKKHNHNQQNKTKPMRMGKK